MIPERERASLKNLSIIVSALAGGLTIFIGITFFLESPDPQKADGVTIWHIMMAVFAVANGTVATFMGRVVKNQTRAKLAEGEPASEVIPGSFLSLTLVRAAMTEGMGFFAAIVYYVAGLPSALGLAAACVLVLLVVVLPTETRYRDFRESVTRPE